MRFALFGALLCGVTLADLMHDAYKDIAHRLLQVMDPTASPCHDFYQYACGNYKTVFSGEDDEDLMTVLQVQILDRVGTALKKLNPRVAPKMPKFPFDQVGIVFSNCIDGEMPSGNASAELQSLNNFIRAIGGWPSLGGWDPSMNPGGPMATAGLLAGLTTVQPMLQSQVTPNLNDPTVNGLLMSPLDVVISNNNISLPSKDNIILAYMHAVRTITNSTKTNEEQAAIDWTSVYIDAMAVARFWYESAFATWDAMGHQAPPTSNINLAKYYSAMFNPYTVEEALKRWPNINLPIFLVNAAYGNTDVKNMFTQPVWFAFPDYFDWLNEAMIDYDQRTLQNLQMFIYAITISQYSSTLRNVLRTPMSMEIETRKRPSPEGLCAYHISSSLPFLVGRVYADESDLSKMDIAELNEMIGLVLSSWHGMIANVEWITEASRQNAYAKIRNVARNVAWPEWIFNDAALADHYRNLNLSLNDDGFITANKALRWTAWQQFSMMGMPVDRYMWTMPPQVVNANYIPVDNSINFPAAIMASPMFNASYPKAVNYARIGWVMGHELGHGFDNNGVYFGSYGQFINTSWIDNATRAGFANMSECVVNEYNKFCLTIDGTQYCVNGQQTLPENIADNGGLIAAHRAFQAVLQLMGGEPHMPTGYGPISTASEEQLFFIAAASTWCNNFPDSALIEQFLFDVHSPDRFRVTGTLRNMPSFGKAFSCKPGDPYMPVSRCHVWTE